MRVLSFDPGATRAGWAVLDTGPSYVVSEVVHYPRLPKQKFQEYRLALTDFWVGEADDLIALYQPDVLVSETIPSRGPAIMDQLYLANVQITTVHAIAYAYGIKVVQVSARSVQSEIALRKEGVKVTKPQVRNGVLHILPELEPERKRFTKVFERTDALAVGLWFMGLSNRLL